MEQYTLKISGEDGHQEECYPWSRSSSGYDVDAKDYVFNDRKNDVSIGIKDTDLFIDAVLNHNHIWDLGMQLERYTRTTHSLTETQVLILKYISSFPCEMEHANWRQRKEVNLEPMMTRNKVKPCQKALFKDPQTLWYHYVGKSIGGCHLHYALCRIIECGSPGYTNDRKRKMKFDTYYIDEFKKIIRLSIKVKKP